MIEYIQVGLIIVMIILSGVLVNVYFEQQETIRVLDNQISILKIIDDNYDRRLGVIDSDGGKT